MTFQNLMLPPSSHLPSSRLGSAQTLRVRLGQGEPKARRREGGQGGRQKDEDGGDRQRDGDEGGHQKAGDEGRTEGHVGGDGSEGLDEVSFLDRPALRPGGGHAIHDGDGASSSKTSSKTYHDDHHHSGHLQTTRPCSDLPSRCHRRGKKGGCEGCQQERHPKSGSPETGALSGCRQLPSPCREQWSERSAPIPPCQFRWSHKESRKETRGAQQATGRSFQQAAAPRPTSKFSCQSSQRSRGQGEFPHRYQQ
mmetsp:Transcript_11218/g.29582  ORF Transcript_11218/g.29582 Transcript_11218/m.29582 type:complete len:252 (-) Transcript_11218:308-1063(-)